MKIKPAAGLAALLLAFWSLAVWSGPALAEGISAGGIRADAARFQAMGGEYNPEGFEEFPSSEMPFGTDRRMNTGRLGGRAVFVNPGDIRILKMMYCSYPEYIYNQLSVMLKNGTRLTFAWQDCLIDCRNGGLCSTKGRLYIDITGDGKPEVRLPSMDSVSTNTFKGRQYWLTFTRDIIPAWVRIQIDSHGLSDKGPEDKIGYWIDQPINIR